MKKKYSITLYGCDDSTTFFDDSTTFFMDLTEEEYTLFKRASELSEETSEYGCMPTMDICLVEE